MSQPWWQPLSPSPAHPSTVTSPLCQHNTCPVRQGWIQHRENRYTYTTQSVFEKENDMKIILCIGHIIQNSFNNSQPPEISGKFKGSTAQPPASRLRCLKTKEITLNQRRLVEDLHIKGLTLLWMCLCCLRPEEVAKVLPHSGQA